MKRRPPGPVPGSRPSTEHPGAPGTSFDPDERMAQDLAALRSMTNQDLPDLTVMTQTLSRRRAQMGRGLGLRRKLMSALVLARRRPGLTAALVGAAAVIAMLVLPVSY